MLFETLTVCLLHYTNESTGDDKRNDKPDDGDDNTGGDDNNWRMLVIMVLLMLMGFTKDDSTGGGDDKRNVDDDSDGESGTARSRTQVQSISGDDKVMTKMTTTNAMLTMMTTTVVMTVPNPSAIYRLLITRKTMMTKEKMQSSRTKSMMK